MGIFLEETLRKQDIYCKTWELTAYRILFGGVHILSADPAGNRVQCLISGSIPTFDNLYSHSRTPLDVGLGASGVAGI